MRLQSNDAINYFGNVKISYTKRGSNVIFVNHNNGKSLLFKLIARALAGYNVSGNLPNAINLQYMNENGDYVDCLRTPMPITRRVILENGTESGNENNTFSSVYTALLNRSNILIFSQNNYRLQLLDISGGVLADSEVDANVIKSIEKSGGIEALIEWSLIFQNGITEDEME